MSLIEKDQIRYEPTLDTVAERLLNSQCVIFLGAGASINELPPSLPTGAGLSRELAAKCRLDWHEYVPLSTIAFYYEAFFTRRSLNTFLAQQFGDETKIPPS